MESDYSTNVNYIIIHMKTIDFSHFIERYIAGEMGEEERAWFERELLDNENLRSEVELRRKTDMVLKNQDVVSLRNKLITDREDAERQPKFLRVNQKGRYTSDMRR